MPAALPGEGSFAASGTAITLCKDGTIYFGTGGPAARIFRSADRGRSWTATKIPLAGGKASRGVFSVACAAESIVAVGGDYKEPNCAERVAAYSHDSGATWHPAAKQPGGYRSAVASFSGDFAAVGPNGTDVSHDQGVHWKHTDALALNAVSFDGEGGWGVGPKGAIARFTTHFHYLIQNRPPAAPPPAPLRMISCPSC
jgi:photosystem II stability/assembly factor-like uncharacterized protein